MITPLEIDHITLQVSNLEETKKYLQSVFDFQFFKHPNLEGILAVESKNIHFFLQKSASPKSFLSKQHISFEIENLDAIEKKLGELGIVYDKGKFLSFKHKNYHWVEWCDRDGIRLECVQKL